MGRLAAGSVVVVTGAASGIGAATAAQLERRGVLVSRWDRTSEAADGRAMDEAVDVTVARDVVAAFARTADAHGRIDAVVHCAGVLRTGLFAELAVEDQLALVSINVGGTVCVAHAAIEHLRATRGTIVLMGSVSAYYGPPEFAAYGATKAAVNSLAQALRIELEDDGVRVAVCNPLFTGTPMLDEHNSRASLVQGVGVVHTADDVAAAIVRGIDAGASTILPGPRTKLLHHAYGTAHGLAHPLMRRAWRRARSQVARVGAQNGTPSSPY